MRNRNGRDLEYVALMDPIVGEGIADLLAYVIELIDTQPGRPSPVLILHA
jgi:hypothetical protein